MKINGQVYYQSISISHTHTLLNCVILGLQDALLLPWTLAIYQAFLMQHWNYGISPSGGENSHSIMMVMLAFFFPCDVITNNYQDMHNIASISYQNWSFLLPLSFWMTSLTLSLLAFQRLIWSLKLTLWYNLSWPSLPLLHSIFHIYHYLTIWS